MTQFANNTAQVAANPANGVTALDAESRLLALIAENKSAIVAYSGGLDSALVLWGCVQALGATQTLAVTSISPSYATGEADAARAFAISIGLPIDRHRFILTREMEIAGYYLNSPERCYFCKGELYAEVEKIRVAEGYVVLFDGLNASDLTDFRPGRKAAHERGVRSPLLECGVTKEVARAIARRHQLMVSDKPASPCLASRVPHGVRITDAILAQIDRAEAALKAMGLAGFRVRYHGDTARVELAPDDLPRTQSEEFCREVVMRVKGGGFLDVTIDTRGYRMGSLNPPTVDKE